MEEVPLECFFEANSDYLVQKLFAAINVSVGSLHTILMKDLQYTPYKMQVSQELKSCDLENRLSFCLKFKQIIEREEWDPADIVFFIWIEEFIN